MGISIDRFEGHTISHGAGYDSKDRPHRYFRYDWYYNGQWVIVDIDCDTPADSAAKARWWNIGLTISDDYRDEALAKCHKKKLITGRMGALGLLFAKAAIQDFEQIVREHYPKYKHFIYCGWLDRRRRRTYAYALKKLDYKYGIRKFKPCLWKEIK